MKSGQRLGSEPSENDGSSPHELCPNAGPSVELCPFGFSSKYLDTESGIVNYEMRSYLTQIGRFISCDPMEEEGGISLYGILGNNLIGQIDFLGMKNWPFTEAVCNGLLNAITDPFRGDWRTIGGLGLRGRAVLDEIGRDNMLAWQLITDPMPLIEKMIEVDQKVNDGMVACAKMEFLYQKDIHFSKALGGMGKFSGSAFLSEQLYKYLLVKGLVKPGWKSATPFGMMMALLQMGSTRDLMG